MQFDLIIRFALISITVDLINIKPLTLMTHHIQIFEFEPTNQNAGQLNVQIVPTNQGPCSYFPYYLRETERGALPHKAITSCYVPSSGVIACHDVMNDVKCVTMT